MLLRDVWLVAVLIGLTLCSFAQRTSETGEWLFADPQETIQTATRTERPVAESFDTSSPYIDGREPLVAGKPEVREYRARFIDRNDQPIGDWSDVVTATAKP